RPSDCSFRVVHGSTGNSAGGLSDSQSCVEGTALAPGDISGRSAANAPYFPVLFLVLVFPDGERAGTSMGNVSIQLLSVDWILRNGRRSLYCGTQSTFVKCISRGICLSRVCIPIPLLPALHFLTPSHQGEMAAAAHLAWICLHPSLWRLANALSGHRLNPQFPDLFWKRHPGSYPHGATSYGFAGFPVW